MPGDLPASRTMSSFATRIRQAREALRRAGERRVGVERRLRQIPVAIERRIKDRRRG